MEEKENNIPRQHIRRWRLLVQTGAFLLLIITPLLNYYLQIHFVQGWYQSLGIGKLWIVSPLEGLESLLVAKIIYLPLLIGMVIPVLVAFFLGRVFCGWICPVHFLSDMSDRVLLFFTRKKRRKDKISLPQQIFWFVLVSDILVALILGAPIFVIFSPPGLIGREIMRAVFFHTLAIEGLIVIAVLLANLVTRRFFCRYFCPLGALLALLGGRRKLRIHHDEEACTECGMCKPSCPLGLDPMKKGADSLYCWNCGECVEICKPGALRLKWKVRP